MLEGICRWNADRRAAASLVSAESYDVQLLTAVNALSSELLGRSLCSWCPKPAAFTGDYLIKNTNNGLSENYLLVYKLHYCCIVYNILPYDCKVLFLTGVFFVPQESSLELSTFSTRRIRRFRTRAIWIWW